MDAQSRPVLARGVRLRNDPITGQPLLLYPEGVLPLDAATHDVISRCTGGHTLEAIIASLADEYEVDQDTLRADVRECLEQLLQQMLIAFSSE
ncbi:MAG: pyrroloquinoline quinone biosynthesis peptide chaperone PqqD [Limisphaerales bacterium]